MTNITSNNFPQNSHSGIDVQKNVHYIGITRYLMKTINVTQARANLFQLIVSVNTDSEPITLTNSKGKNAVLVGEDDWNSIQETLYLMSIPGMYESIKEGMEEGLEKSIPAEEVNW